MTAGTARRPDAAVLRRIRLARDAMDRDWSQPLDLDRVAAEAGYSRYHFVRLFRRTYGETPGQYLSRRRIERACELLRSANLTITEVRVPRAGAQGRAAAYPRLLRPVLAGRISRIAAD